VKEPIAIHWFRRDLRLHDNAALWAALRSGKKVLPIFIFDRSILDVLTDRTDARVQFIHNEIGRLKIELQALGSDLFVHFGTVQEGFDSILKLHSVTEVYVNRDYEPYAQERDQQMFHWLAEKNITLRGRKDHVIFEKSEVVKDDGKPYTVFTPYSKKWKAKLTAYHLKAYPTENYFQNFLPVSIPFGLPSLEEMKFSPSDTEFPERIFPEKIVKKYAEQRDIPSIKGTSRLSLHLRFGTVSIRSLAASAQKTSEKWLNELIWRDFYQMIIVHYPHTVNAAFKPIYDRIAWRDSPEDFERWCAGETGYPIVDAGMRELNATGFMHNRVRMVVASFLTKHLLIDWRMGERYFAAKLLDFELASNVGGWQWAAGSGCDAAPYFRIFNPESQTQKFDPQFEYIKKWVPEFGTSRYPKPIVDHKFARERCLTTFKSALVG
jgi:deoxyribodipyrimidine photo-lyase